MRPEKVDRVVRKREAMKAETSEDKTSTCSQLDTQQAAKSQSRKRSVEQSGVRSGKSASTSTKGPGTKSSRESTSAISSISSSSQASSGITATKSAAHQEGLNSVDLAMDDIKVEVNDDSDMKAITKTKATSPVDSATAEDVKVQITTDTFEDITKKEADISRATVIESVHPSHDVVSADSKSCFQIYQSSSQAFSKVR